MLTYTYNKLYSSVCPAIKWKSMVGGSRGEFQPHNHTRAIILPMILEKMLSHHASRATAPVTETALEQDPYMLGLDMIVSSTGRHFNVSTEWANMLAPIPWEFGRWWHMKISGQS